MIFNDDKVAVICFLRHGQTDWNKQQRMQGQEEVPLNENGKREAWEAAEGFYISKCNGVSWDKIISSPLSRAKDTANAVAQRIGFDNVTTDDRLLERDFGDLSGFGYTEYSIAVHSNVKAVATIESTENMLARINEFIKDNVKVGEHVLIVTHGAVTRFFAKSSEKQLSEAFPDYKDVIHNCHCAVYTYDGKEVVLKAYDITSDNIYKV